MITGTSKPASDGTGLGVLATIIEEPSATPIAGAAQSGAIWFLSNPAGVVVTLDKLAIEGIQIIPVDVTGGAGVTFVTEVGATPLFNVNSESASQGDSAFMGLVVRANPSGIDAQWYLFGATG